MPHELLCSGFPYTGRYNWLCKNEELQLLVQRTHTKNVWNVTGAKLVECIMNDFSQFSSAMFHANLTESKPSSLPSHPKTQEKQMQSSKYRRMLSRELAPFLFNNFSGLLLSVIQFWVKILSLLRMRYRRPRAAILSFWNLHSLFPTLFNGKQILCDRRLVDDCELFVWPNLNAKPASSHGNASRMVDSSLMTLLSLTYHFLIEVFSWGVGWEAELSTRASLWPCLTFSHKLRSSCPIRMKLFTIKN